MSPEHRATCRLAGVAPGAAVAWAREHYHRRAAETPWQRRWVAGLVAPDR